MISGKDVDAVVQLLAVLKDGTAPELYAEGDKLLTQAEQWTAMLQKEVDTVTAYNKSLVDHQAKCACCKATPRRYCRLIDKMARKGHSRIQRSDEFDRKFHAWRAKAEVVAKRARELEERHADMERGRGPTEGGQATSD